MQLINSAATALTFRQGDTALGLEIDIPKWDVTGATVTFILEDMNGNTVSPFHGQAATIVQTSGPARLQYTWPSALPAGKYVGAFLVVFVNTQTLSTRGVLIVCLTP